MNKEKWIARALEKGIEGFEIYESTSAGRDVTWFDQQMDTYVTSRTFGISLRGQVEGNTAYVAMEEVDESRMDAILDQLIAQTKIITAEESSSLSAPSKAESVENPRIWVKPEMDQVYAVMAKIEKDLLAYDERIIQVSYLAWSESFGTRSIRNSLGLDVADKEGFQAMICQAAAQGENGEIKDDFLVKIVPDLKDFDVDAFVKELAEGALGKLGAGPISSRKCPVILEREAMTSLFSAFTGLFSGELIAKGISPLAGKLGEKIFSDKITIIDNPRNTDALSIANFDDEGVPTKEKIVVDHGVFACMLHSSRSAKKLNTVSSGNGFKSGYASAVGVSPYNMYIVPGEDDLKALEEKMENGLVIKDLAGLHAGIDFVSTSFSLQCSGYLVENGKRTRPVTLITVAGTFMDLMKKVKAVGSDLDWKYYSVAAPSIYFEECSISGE